MKFNFKKISAIATSVLMTGMTIGTAMAAGIAPSDLGGQGNFAIVYGATAHSLDQTQATAIDTALRNQFSTSTSVVVGDVALTDDEVVLNGNVDGNRINSPIRTNKLDGLLKGKVSFDDGTSDKAWDIYEAIEITSGKIKVETNLNGDDKLEGVALTNDKGLFYKLYLDNTLNQTNVSSENTIELPILGVDYEISKIAGGEITVTTSSEAALGVGQTYTLSNGKTVTLSGVFTGSVEVLIDGVSKIISENKNAKVNGVRVQVNSIGYNSNAPDTSRAVLRIGEDLSKTYTDGEEFIGEDEDDPEWVWEIGNFDSTAPEHYIGVQYNYKKTKEKDGLKYIGEGYVFPNNYAAVTLDGLTEVDYQDVEIAFEESYLYSNNDSADDNPLDTNVIMIRAEEDDSIKIGNIETKEIAIYAINASGKANISVYALDVDKDYTPSGKFRFADSWLITAETSLNIADISIGDTDLSVNLSGAGLADLTKEANLTISGSSTLLNVAIKDLLVLDRIGANEGDSVTGEVFFGTKDVSTSDYSFMDSYGVVISKGTTVESEADSDEITLSVPEEQVHAKVSVSMGASTTSTGSVGNMIFRDTEASSYAGKNVVIVGGSCVNSAAATVLGVASDRGVPGCYADTGLSAGQFLIKKGLLNGKTAIVVAGYEADDTVKAAQFLINKGAVDGKYTSTTSEKIA